MKYYTAIGARKLNWELLELTEGTAYGVDGLMSAMRSFREMEKKLSVIGTTAPCNRLEKYAATMWQRAWGQAMQYDSHFFVDEVEYENAISHGLGGNTGLAEHMTGLDVSCGAIAEALNKLIRPQCCLSFSCDAKARASSGHIPCGVVLADSLK